MATTLRRIPNSRNVRPTGGRTSRQQFRVVKDRAELDKIIREAALDEDLNYLDVSAIDDMSWLFLDSKFNGRIDHWDVSGVKTMEGMFCRSAFTGELPWDVRNCLNFNKCFQDAAFNQPLGHWDVLPVAKTDNMFYCCPAVEWISEEKD